MLKSSFLGRNTEIVLKLMVDVQIEIGEYKNKIIHGKTVRTLL